MDFQSLMESENGSTAVDDLRSCPACGHSTREFEVVSGKSDMQGNALRLATCPNCRTVFQPMTPTRADLARWYDYMGHNSGNTRFSMFNRQRLERLMHSLERFVPCGRLLEIGCGDGLLLQIAQGRGWEVYGTEISSSCCELLRPKLGDHLWEGELSEIPFQPGSFDLIIFIEVIEHLPDPFAYLRVANRVLRQGGSLYITTPNFHGVSGRIWGTAWRVVGNEHLNYFNEYSMSVLLRNAGFSAVSISATGLDGSHMRKGAVKAMGEELQTDSTGSAGKQTPGLVHSLRNAAINGAIDVGNYVLGRMRLGDTLKVRAVKLHDILSP